jgi:hypothetical protein
VADCVYISLGSLSYNFYYPDNIGYMGTQVSQKNREWNIKECEEWSKLWDRIVRGSPLVRDYSIEEYNRYKELDSFYGGHDNRAMMFEAYQALLTQAEAMKKELEFYGTRPAIIGFKKQTKEIFEYGDDNKPNQFGKRAREVLANVKASGVL